MNSIGIISFLIVLAFPSLFLSCCSASCGNLGRSIDAVYQLGDSTSDTGNLVWIVGTNSTAAVATHPPYGQTFRKPTGRFSDGLLIVDYITTFLGLPFLNPILKPNRSFKYGADFAVAGSTVLNSSFYVARNVTVPAYNTPLRTQLQWFKSFLNSTCKTPSNCSETLKRSLVIVGEVGRNDFIYSFAQGKPIREVRTYVPFVVRETIAVTRELIKLGVPRVLVFGDYPIGCSPYYLTNLASNDNSAYDDKGCLIEFNDIERYRNSYVRAALAPVRLEFPQATILYGDYYGGYQNILRNASLLGFDPSSVLKACCGTGGSYNFNVSTFCGSPGVPVCANPDQLISWDGIHLTQSAHYRIAEFIIKQILPGLSRAD